MQGTATGGRRRPFALFAALVVVALVAPWTTTGASAAELTQKPRQSSGGKLATLQIEAPSVEVKRAGRPSFATAKDGQALKAGDTVRTSTSGRAQISYADGSLTRLDVSTEYQLAKLSNKKGDRKTKGVQTAGQTWHRVEKLSGDDSYKVEGASATAAVLGTAFMVSCVSTTQCTFTAVIDEIQLTDAGARNGTKTVTLTPGDQAVVSDDAIGPVTTLTQEELLAIQWIVDNLLADGSSPSEISSQGDPPPTRPASSPIVVPPPPAPATTTVTGDGGAGGTGTGGAGGGGTETGEPGTGGDGGDGGDGGGDGGSVPPPANQAPIAANDAFSMPEDAILAIAAPGVLGNDSDPDGDPLELFLTGLPSHGALQVFPNGAFVYAPDDDFAGIDSWTYVAGDGEFGSNTGIVTITVGAVNDAPVAQDDSYTTTEATALDVTAPGVLGNDSDPEGGALTASLVAAPQDGEVSLNGDGSFTYTPDDEFTGTDSFTYLASDGSLQSNVATVTITVTSEGGGENQAPTADNNSYTTDEDTPLSVDAPGVLGNDNDPDGDDLTAELDTECVGLVCGDTEQGGTVVLDPEGSFTYTPPDNFSGQDSFQYVASDGEVESNVATVTITVTPVNDAPVGTNDSYTVDENDNLTVTAPGVLGNDSDPDAGDTLAAEFVDSDIGEGEGTLQFHTDGSFEYTPGDGFTGQVSFRYRATDGELDSDPVTVTITVEAANLPSVFPQIFQLDPQDWVTFNFSASGATSFVVDSLPSSGTLAIGETAVQAGQDVGTDQLTFFAPEDPGTYSFTWHAVNGDGDSVTATQYFMVGLPPLMPDIFFYAPDGEPSTGEIYVNFPQGIPDLTCAITPVDPYFSFDHFIYTEGVLVGYAVRYNPPDGLPPQVLSFPVNACFGDGYYSGSPDATLAGPTTVYVGVGYSGEEVVDPPVASFSNPMHDSGNPTSLHVEADPGQTVTFQITATDPNGLPIDVFLDDYNGPPGSLDVVGHSGSTWTLQWTPENVESGQNTIDIRVRNLAGESTTLTLHIDWGTPSTTTTTEPPPTTTPTTVPPTTTTTQPEAA